MGIRDALGPLAPAERIDAIVDLAPEKCRHCAHWLHARHAVGEPRRHQVTELPPITAHITEYRCHRRECPVCGQTTLAALPEEHRGQFGPQLTALTAYLTVVCRLPRLVVQRFLAGALQIPISLGSTQHAWEEASVAVATPYADLEAELRPEPVLNADETGHHQRRQAMALDVCRPYVRGVSHCRVARLRRVDGYSGRHVRPAFSAAIACPPI